MDKQMIELNKENFEQEVVKYKGKVVVDCWANWCGKCKMIKPKFEELSKTRTDYKFCTLDVDKCQQLAADLNILNLPTFIIIDSGNEVSRGGFEILETL